VQHQPSAALAAAALASATLATAFASSSIATTALAAASLAASLAAALATASAQLPGAHRGWHRLPGQPPAAFPPAVHAGGDRQHGARRVALVRVGSSRRCWRGVARRFCACAVGTVEAAGRPYAA